MCFILIVIDTRVWQEVVSTPQNPPLRVLSIRSSKRSSGENKAFLSFYINFFSGIQHFLVLGTAKGSI